MKDVGKGGSNLIPRTHHQRKYGREKADALLRRIEPPNAQAIAAQDPAFTEKTKNHMTPKERARLVDLLKEGKSFYYVRKKTGRSLGTVRRVAAQEGISTPNPECQAMTIARRIYAIEERIKLSDEALDKARELLYECETPKDLQHWAVAFGILVEKRRLEVGSATSRPEIGDANQAKDYLVAKLDELVIRRKQREAIELTADTVDDAVSSTDLDEVSDQIALSDGDSLAS
jgi:hypothetical protein